MTSFRVTFFKNLVNSNGHEFKCPQGTVEIRRARSTDRAFQAAERRFERAKNINDWTLYADVAEMQSTEADGSSWCCAEPASLHRRSHAPGSARTTLGPI